MRLSKELRFLITAGPTREYLDPIRFLSNRSSGKMGYALAEAARALSPHVLLISGPVALAAPAGVEFVAVTSAQEMADAVFARFADCDVAIMCAAVCDFRPRQAAARKIKKEQFPATLGLEPTADILAELGRRKQSQVLVGFAAETNDVEDNAQKKLLAKRLDLIVANDARAFDAETNTVTLIDRDGRLERWPELPKRDVAARLIARALELAA